jgi:F-type H+-transporting ATPase subunit epsilon
MGTGAAMGVQRLTAVVERRDDVVEPAYPMPPTSPNVSAGPRSAMPFASMGKEGRRFVLMALSPEEITAVTGERAMSPVRVVGGYESAPDTAERAKDLDEAAAQSAKHRAEQVLADHRSEFEFARAKAELAEAVAQLQTIERLRKLRKSG